MIRRLAACIAASLPAALAPAQAFPQAFPSKPVRMVTQFAAGSPGDLVTRIVAQQLREPLGQPVVVDNRVGGGGVLAAGVIAQAAPDGYTVGFLNTTVPVASVATSQTYTFDPAKAFTPITTLMGTTSVILAGPTLKARTLQETIAFARTNPGVLSYGTPGIGSAHHLAGEQIRLLTGADMVHVPYKTQPLFDAAGGVLPLAYAVLARALPLLKSGKLRALAVIGTARSPLLPEVPTVGEVVAGFETPPAWTGLFGPAGLPPEVLARLHADTVKALMSPEGRERILAAEFEPLASRSPAEFAAQIRRDVVLVGKLFKAAGISAPN